MSLLLPADLIRKKEFDWRQELKSNPAAADILCMFEFGGLSLRPVAVLIAFLLQLCCPPVASGASTLLFASTLGGGQSDTVFAIATDSAQNIYLVGETYSTDFPSAAPSNHSRASGDAFIVKLNSSGTQILYSVVFGGSNYDSARGVAVDAAGNAYVTGVTDSSDFPATAGAFQKVSASPGAEDAFVIKFSSSGTVLYASYLGGSSNDAGYAIAVDSSGATYVAGSTASVNFPTTSNVPQSSLKGVSNCFVAKLGASGATLSYSTLIGGENIDLCKGVVVDTSGSAFVTGTTSSTAFPVVAALKSTLSGPYDAFLARLSPAGDQFVFSTYIGGEAVDEGNAVYLDQAGNVYVGGDTTSTAFPVTSGVLQSHLDNNYDGFVCAVANDGSKILWATYLGGSGSDSITALSLTPDGRILASGYTSSPDFPVSGAVQSSFGGVFDAFAVVMASDGSSLSFATYIGGGGDDRAYGITSVGPGQFAVAGQMLSGSVSYVSSLYSVTPSGQYDGFIAAISYGQSLRLVPMMPCRVVDTRNPAGAFGGPTISGGATRTFVIPQSACGVPVTAQAYSLNVAVVPSGPLAYLRVWPTGQVQPSTSTVNSDGRVKSTAAIVPAGTSGAVNVFATNTTDVVLDINGYFVLATTPTALAFYPVTPCRIADTRNSVGPFGGPSFSAGQARSFPISSAPCSIPPNAQAYSLNFTAIPEGFAEFLTAWPSQTMPLASTLNATTGTVTANAAIVQASSTGSIQVFASAATDLAIDTNGYFASPGPAGLSLYNVAPCRVVDTRLPAGTPPASGIFSFPIAGNCGVPATAEAYVVNVTVVPQGSLGFITLWPWEQPQPQVSTLNAQDGAITSNMAIVPSSNGRISAFLTSTTYLVMDIAGYLAP